MMLGGSGVVLGGGYWTCSKCGRTISGSSIHHNCTPFKKKGFDRLIRKIKISLIIKQII
jgi:ribosomal protein L37AE/L43A